MYNDTPPSYSNAEAAQASDPLQLIATHSADGLLIINAQGQVGFANPAVARLFGRAPEHLLGQPLGLPLTAGTPTEVELLQPDGGVIFAELQAEPVSWRGEPAFMVTLHDVTARKRAEQLLIESQQLLRTALDSLSAQVAILDEHGTIAVVNAAWRAFSDQRASGSGVGTNYLALWDALDSPEERRAAAGLRAVLQRQRQRFSMEYALEEPAGRQWFAMHVSSCGEQPWGRAVVALESITERKQVEALDMARQRVLELVARQQPLEVVANELLVVAAERYSDVAYVALALRGVGLFRSRAVGLAPTTVAALDMLVLEAEPLMASTAPLQVVLDNAPDSVAGAAGLGCCWQARLPLSASDQIGVLRLYRRSVAQPGADDVHFIELLSQLLSIAVEQHEHMRRLAFQAHHDALTGLPNRALFADRLQQALELARRAEHRVGVLFIDLDRFKQINDTFGHSVGDALLVQLARRFEACVRASDTLARRGGDEFMLVLPELAEVSQVTRVAHRLHEMLRMPFVVDGNEFFLSASIGASIFPDDGEDADTLQRNADAAMYRAKTTLRNSFQLFDASANQAALERLQLENYLRRAVERGELSVYYQPKVDRAGRLAGAEALLRWHQPELGPVPPAHFIPLAEELGLIVPIGEWCLAEICRQLVSWQQDGLPLVPVAVNISAVQFAQPGFLPMVVGTITRSGLVPTLFELELTESMLLGDFESLVRQLRDLRALQIALAIDDFGTGYSSLAYLQRLPLTTLKVDRSFVARLDEAEDDGHRGIVSAIVTLGRHLRLQLVAEGVETDAQRRFLSDLGCDLFQGFYFSEPLPAERFAHVLAAHGAGPA